MGIGDKIRPAVRTRHFHVKVQAPHGPILTTQLYFPDEPRKGRDLLFDRKLLMTVDDRGDHKVARFDFVVKLRAPIPGYSQGAGVSSNPCGRRVI